MIDRKRENVPEKPFWKDNELAPAGKWLLGIAAMIIAVFILLGDFDNSPNRWTEIQHPPTATPRSSGTQTIGPLQPTVASGEKSH